MTVLLILMLLGMPALMRMLERQKAYGAATELTALMRLARLEAIKGGRRCGVAVDYTARAATGFVDANNNDLLDPGEETFGQVVLPKNIEFWGPLDGAAGGNDASIGLPEDSLEGTAIFDSTGAARVVITASELWGAFRLKARDQNFFEVRIASPITGRVEARKWMGGTEWWVNGQHGKAWRWFDTGETPAPPAI
jgi:hypothetical protein